RSPPTARRPPGRPREEVDACPRPPAPRAERAPPRPRPRLLRLQRLQLAQPLVGVITPSKERLCLRHLRLARRGREPALGLGALGGKPGDTFLRVFQVLPGCVVSLLKLAQPVVVGPHCTRPLQPARYALEPLACRRPRPLR